AQQGRLIAGARADFEDLVARVNAERARHAPDDARRRDRDAEADVEIVPDVGLLAIFGQDEFLARRHEKGPLVGGGPQIVEGKELLITVEAAAEQSRVLAAVRRHPG